MGRWLCAAMMTIAAVTATAAGVGADPPPEGKRLVTLGDSFTANGVFLFKPSPEGHGCEQGESAWPAQLSQLMAAPAPNEWSNQSCPGASLSNGPGYTVAAQALDAAKTGSFGPRTELVTLQFGVNDRWGKSTQSLWNALDACILAGKGGCNLGDTSEGGLPDPAEVTGAAYADRLKSAVTYLRYYAPNARIVLVGYPEMFAANQDTACIKLLGLVPFDQPNGRIIIEYMDRLDKAQREAAALLQLDFLDTRALTAGHGACSPDPWVNGMFQLSTAGGIAYHPMPEGDAVVAKALRDKYIR